MTRTIYRNHSLNISHFQFEDVALNTALYLLDRANLYDGARGNPILVLRALSALVITISAFCQL